MILEFGMKMRQLADREKAFLKLLQAKATINSGATFSDGDGVLKQQIGDYDKIGVEIKCTDAKSYILKIDTWEKINNEARRIGQMPLLGIDIQNTKLVLMSANDFMGMLSFIEVLLSDDKNQKP